MNKPKILFLIPTLKGGGAERVLLTLLKYLPKDKYEIALVSIFKGALPEYLQHIKYRWIFDKIFRGNVHLLKLLSPKFLFRYFIGNSSNYDIIVSYLHSPTMRIAVGGVNGRTKLINWIHNEFKSADELSRLFRTKQEFEKSMKAYDRTIFVAESARQSTLKLLPYLQKNSRTIYNTIDTETIRKRSHEPIEDDAFAEDTLNLISVGRFSIAKAFDRLIRITKAVADSGVKVHLHLLGQGALEPNYRDEIDKLGIADLVSFPGFVDNPYQYVASADLFVCSSLHEGFSTAVTESLIVGTPVVTTLCSGMEELLGRNGEYGIITPNNEKDLTDAVLELALHQDRLKQLAEKAAERGRQFNKENTVADVVKLFNELIEQ